MDTSVLRTVIRYKREESIESRCDFLKFFIKSISFKQYLQRDRRIRPVLLLYQKEDGVGVWKNMTSYIF